MTRRTTAVTGGVLASAALAFLTGGVAGAVPDEDVLVSADLDGDGRPDRVTIRSAGTAEQRVVARVDGREVDVAAPADTPGRVVPPRVTDLNGDDVEELAVPEYSGANTGTFGVWSYVDGELRSVGDVNGEALRLYEGGGVAARSGYTCEEVDGALHLAVLTAEADDTAGPLTYTGSWTYYRVADGLVTPVGAEIPFTSVDADSALLSPDEGACGIGTR